MKKTIQIIYVIVIALFAIIPANAQQPDFMFVHSFPMERPYYGSCTLEVASEDGHNVECFFVAVCYGDVRGDGIPYMYYEPGMHFSAKVIKLSPTGEIEGEITLGQEGISSIIDGLYRDPDHQDYYIAIGRMENEEFTFMKPFMAKFDKQLNLIWMKEIELQDDYKKYMSAARTLLDNQGELVFCTILMDNIQIKNRIFLRLSTEGELLAFGEFPELTRTVEGPQGYLFEYQDGSGDYGQISQTGVNNMEASVWRMNRNFEVVNQKSLPYTIDMPQEVLCFSYHWQSGAQSFPDGSLLIGGYAGFIEKNNYPNGIFSDVVFMMKYDENDSLVNLSYKRPECEDIIYLADKNPLDGESNAFFICNWQVPRPGYFDVPSSLVVTKTDNNANIIWQRYYQEDNHLLVAKSIMTTVDEGCLVTGCFWDVPTTTKENMFVLKFFADGSLSVPKMEEFVRPYCFYPNPVKDQLRMQFSPDVQPDKVELYDLQGRLVRTQSKAFESIDMSQLPAGTYTLRVTLADGKSYSDKVVKE